MNAQSLAEKVVERMLAEDAFSAWMGLEVLSVRPGAASVRMTVRPEMLNGFKRGHGGVAFSLADSALAFASNSRGRIAYSIENGMAYSAPVFEGDVLTATAEEVSAGGRIAVYQALVENQNQQCVAVFRGTVYRTNREFFPDGDRE